MGGSSGTRLVPLKHDGLDRAYLLHEPPVAGASPRPLVVQLHGRGIGAAIFDRMTGFSALADTEGFVVALPEGRHEVWNDGRGVRLGPGPLPDDVGYLLAVVDDVCSRVRIDPQRIYLVGMSNGAAMAGRLVCEAPGRFAALAQVSGAAGVEVTSRCRDAGPLPILHIHGADDRMAPYRGGVRRGLIARLVLRVAARPSIGVDAWAQQWIAANGAAPEPTITRVAPDVELRSWRGAGPQSNIDFYRIEGGGHTWPGSTFRLPRIILGRTSSFDATRTIWAFFAAHRRAT